MKRSVYALMGILGAIAIFSVACQAGAGETPEPEETTPPPATETPADTEEPTAAATEEPTADGANGGGDLVAQGEEIFVGEGGCGSCHQVEGVSSGMVGPDLTNIGTEAAERRPDYSAREYIEESIRDPEAFVAEGVERAQPGIMTEGVTSGLSDQQVEALTEFLLAQQ